MSGRVVIIVLDGVGVGALPDAAEYSDAGAATLPHVAEAVGGLALPVLERLGLGLICPIVGVEAVAKPQACWGKMAELSPGKDSVTGHWELAGVVLDKPFSTFPGGFPEQLIDAFIAVSGLEVLGNVVASGTDIIRQLGEEHMRTGRPIIYTSSDSVFQIAAHETVIPPQKLYNLCRLAEQILIPYNVCRVIARPFIGVDAASFRRTAGRHDFPQAAPEPTLLERLTAADIPTIGVGKIYDLFAGRGVSQSFPTNSNCEGMDLTLEAFEQMKCGLLMTNLVDFDMLYGHRCDIAGFAEALEKFDCWLPRLLQKMNNDDLVLITADHGCDPTTPGTDHSREYVPLLAWSPALKDPNELGIRQTFADVGASIADYFSVTLINGRSFMAKIGR